VVHHLDFSGNSSNTILFFQTLHSVSTAAADQIIRPHHNYISREKLSPRAAVYTTISTKAKMVFKTPAWVPQISTSVPDSVLVGDFVTKRDHNLYDWSDEKPTTICALSGGSYNMREIRDRVSSLSQSLSKDLGWLPNQGSPWDKVVGICSFNTVSSGHHRGLGKYVTDCTFRLIF
jgi:hypothetical protein